MTQSTGWWPAVGKSTQVVSDPRGAFLTEKSFSDAIQVRNRVGRKWNRFWLIASWQYFVYAQGLLLNWLTNVCNNKRIQSDLWNPEAFPNKMPLDETLVCLLELLPVSGGKAGAACSVGQRRDCGLASGCRAPWEPVMCIRDDWGCERNIWLVLASKMIFKWSSKSHSADWFSLGVPHYQGHSVFYWPVTSERSKQLKY